MGVDTEYQVIEGATGDKFFVGSPINLLGRRDNQNITDASILGISIEEYKNWMIARGAKEISVNEKNDFVLYSFTEKRKASKAAKELTKAYLKYRMGK